MLSPSIISHPSKVKLSVQILMTLDNCLSSSPKMSLLFLRFIRLFVTSQMENAPLRTVPWTFCPSLLCYDPEHSFALAKSLLLRFFRSTSEQFCGFLYVFILVLNFSKALGCCQTYLQYLLDLYSFPPPISSSLPSS